VTDLNLLISDAIRTVEHSPHTLSGASLQVPLYEEPEVENHDDFDENTAGEDGSIDENDIIIIVSGILPSTSEEAVENYFENSRRSGGGEISNIDYTDDGDAIITFLEVKGMSSIALPGFPGTYEVYVMRCQMELPLFSLLNDFRNQKLSATDFRQTNSDFFYVRKRSSFTFTAKMLEIPKGIANLREVL